MRRTLLSPILLLLALGVPASAADWVPYPAGGVNALLVQGEGRPAGGRPLLVILHGCAQSNAALQQPAIAEAADAAGGVIALPAVPGGGVYAGCWDYYGRAHTDANRHLGPLITFVEALVADPALGVDPARVWIAGLSSGAGEAMAAGCVAPDLFSGVIAVGGPGLGTEAAQIAVVATQADSVTALCRQISRAPAAFERQQAVFVVGTADYIVAQGYAPVNAAGFAALYGAQEDRVVDLADLPGSAAGAVRVWSTGDADRVALLTVDGLDHAWPLGRGAGATQQFVAQGGPDVALWAFEFFGGVAVDPPVEPAPTPEPAPQPEPEPATGCMDAPAERVDATLVGHALRFGVHGGVYGAVDAAYVDLLSAYGTATPFALYRGPDGWYHDPARVPSRCDPAAPPGPEPGPEARPEPRPEPRPDPAPEPDPPIPPTASTPKASSGCRAIPGAGAAGWWWLLVLGGAIRRRR